MKDWHLNQEVTTLKVGLVLESNHATVLEFKPSAYEGCHVVLCLWPTSVHHPFVVWTYSDTDGACVSGDYFDNLPDALNRYKERGH